MDFGRTIAAALSVGLIVAGAAWGQAPADQTTAVVDHQGALEDRAGAAEDRGLAEADRNGAKIDRRLAQDDRGKAASDRAEAEADQSRAAATVRYFRAHPPADVVPVRVGETTALGTVKSHLGARNGHPPAATLTAALAGCIAPGPLGPEEAPAGSRLPPGPNNDQFECVRRVGFNAIISYKHAAGDREAFANADAWLTTMGLGGAVLGKDHWSSKDTIGWWSAAGAFGLIYDELSGTKPRANLYGAGAQASRMAIYRSSALHIAVKRLGPPRVARQWPPYEIKAGEPVVSNAFVRIGSLCDQISTSASAKTLSKEETKAEEKFKGAAALRCEALRKLNARLERIRTDLCPRNAMREPNCDDPLAYALADDLGAIDDMVANADRGLRARSTDVAGVVVRAAANVVANLALTISQGDVSSVSYNGRTFAVPEALDLNRIPDFALPEPIDEDIAVPDVIRDAAAKSKGLSVQEAHLASLANYAAKLDDLTDRLNDDLSAAAAIQAINRRNRLRFDLKPPANPVTFAPIS